MPSRLKTLERRIKKNARIDSKQDRVFLVLPRGTYNELLDLLETFPDRRKRRRQAKLLDETG